MEKPLKSANSAANKTTWATMDGTQKAAFIAKICIMVCTFGFIYGGVLMEGVTYEPFQ